MNRRVIRGRFGQLTGQDLLTKYTQCLQQGKGLDMSTGQCCEPADCIQGWTPGMPWTPPVGGAPPGYVPPVTIPGNVPPPPVGGTGQLPMGYTVVETKELDALKKERDSLGKQRVVIGIGAALGGLLLGAGLGYAIAK